MTRPATTGGRPISALSATTIAPRPGKRATASSAPSGSPASAAIAVAASDTRSERPTICHSPASPEATRRAASAKAAPKSPIRRL